MHAVPVTSLIWNFPVQQSTWKPRHGRRHG
jgi:hypothetical protein